MKNSTRKHSPGKWIWGNLIHLSHNMWEDEYCEEKKDRCYYPELRFDEPLYEEIIERMAAVGMNMIVIDVGDGVKFKSRPEIPVKNAWSRERMKKEVARLRKMGLEPIPKLNFSTAHDAWLGQYHRMVSTPAYYEVCRDLIRETAELFDKPRFFHLGMDEETPSHQRLQKFMCVRQYDLWWHDMFFYIKEVEKLRIRPWVWSDYMWQHLDLYLKNMPRSVLQSNWYYHMNFYERESHVTAYDRLEEKKYDQVPTGSNHHFPDNLARTVDYCTKTIDPKRLLGFLQTPWRPTVRHHRRHHLEAVEVTGKIIEALKS
jgi:hypothetical protein